MKYLKYLLILFFAISSLPVLASEEIDYSIFKNIYEIQAPELTKPTVVNVYLPKVQNHDILLLEEGNEIAQPWLRSNGSIKEPQTEIRFLARSNKKYTLYADAVSSFNIKTAEKGDLDGSDIEVQTLDILNTKINLDFVEPDTDEDGIINDEDNCVSIANPDQADIDNNNIGDACDDFDGDGVLNGKDNCPEHPNARQKDEDADNIGDVCDDEENRFTEKNEWLPWLVMFVSTVVIGVIIVKVVRNNKK